MSYTEKITKLYKDGKIPESSMVKAAAFKAVLEENLELTKTALDWAGIKSTATSPGTKEKINWFKNIGSSAVAKAGLVLGGYALSQGLDILETKADNNGIGNYFENMLAMRPELRNEDQLVIKKYFDSLMHFAPAIAKEPLAASAYITQAIQYEEAGGPPYSTIESLVKTQKTYREVNPLRVQRIGELFSQPKMKL